MVIGLVQKKAGAAPALRSETFDLKGRKRWKVSRVAEQLSVSHKKVRRILDWAGKRQR